jgi:uncharacterized protein (DUF58 family)
MLPSEILAQVRRIEIRTGRLVAETLAGEYLSVFKGQGIEFAEVREYQPGDDIRTIDWNVTARLGRPFIKRFAEERELTVMIACDLSGSLAFGSQSKLKREIATELSALLAFSAMSNNDKAGLALFTDRVEKFIPPRKGRLHVLRLLRELLAFQPEQRGTAIASSLESVQRMVRRRGILFLISDFMDSGYEKVLRRVAKRHDLVPIVLEDPRESELPDAPVLIEFEDSETGERALVPAWSKSVRESYRKAAAKRRHELERFFKSAGIEHIRVRTDKSYVDPVVAFFKNRSRRLR